MVDTYHIIIDQTPLTASTTQEEPHVDILDSSRAWQVSNHKHPRKHASRRL